MALTSNETTRTIEQVARNNELKPLQDSGNVLCYLKQYAKDHPAEAAMWCFGAGFLMGWKLRPW